MNLHDKACPHVEFFSLIKCARHGWFYLVFFFATHEGGYYNKVKVTGREPFVAFEMFFPLHWPSELSMNQCY